jgi:hypothetical protein
MTAEDFIFGGLFAGLWFLWSADSDSDSAPLFWLQMYASAFGFIVAAIAVLFQLFRVLSA